MGGRSGEGAAARVATTDSLNRSARVAAHFLPPATGRMGIRRLLPFAAGPKSIPAGTLRKGIVPPWQGRALPDAGMPRALQTIAIPAIRGTLSGKSTRWIPLLAYSFSAGN